MKAFESRALFIYSPQLMWAKHPDTLSAANLNGRSNTGLSPAGGVRAALASSLPGRASYKPRAVHGLYGEEHQISHQADREIHYAGYRALTSSLDISLQHQNSAVIPPADTPHPARAAPCSHPELHPQAEVSCPAPHPSQDLHVHMNIGPVTSSLSLPMRAEYRVLRPLSLCENSQ